MVAFTVLCCGAVSLVNHLSSLSLALSLSLSLSSHTLSSLYQETAVTVVLNHARPQSSPTLSLGKLGTRSLDRYPFSRTHARTHRPSPSLFSSPLSSPLLFTRPLYSFSLSTTLPHSSKSSCSPLPLALPSSPALPVSSILAPPALSLRPRPPRLDRPSHPAPAPAPANLQPSSPSSTPTPARLGT